MLIKVLYLAHHIYNKDLRRYYRKWQEGKRKDESLLPAQRGARPGSRRTPKEIERNIMKAYRRFGSNRYELVLLFKPYYLDRTPSPATMDRIKKRYPLNPAQKEIIKRYEKVTPGELAHIDLTKVPKDICMVFKIKDLYVAGLEDDCTRLTYSEILKDKKASTLTYFMARAPSWLAAHPASQVIEDSGEHLLPEAAQYANDNIPAEKAAKGSHLNPLKYFLLF